MLKKHLFKGKSELDSCMNGICYGGRKRTGNSCQHEKAAPLNWRMTTAQKRGEYLSNFMTKSFYGKMNFWAFLPFHSKMKISCPRAVSPGSAKRRARTDLKRCTKHDSSQAFQPACLGGFSRGNCNLAVLAACLPAFKSAYSSPGPTGAGQWHNIKITIEYTENTALLESNSPSWSEMVPRFPRVLLLEDGETFKYSKLNKSR